MPELGTAARSTQHARSTRLSRWLTLCLADRQLGTNADRRGGSQSIEWKEVLDVLGRDTDETCTIWKGER